MKGFEFTLMATWIAAETERRINVYVWRVAFSTYSYGTNHGEPFQKSHCTYSHLLA